MAIQRASVHRQFRSYTIHRSRARQQLASHNLSHVRRQFKCGLSLSSVGLGDQRIQSLRVSALQGDIEPLAIENNRGLLTVKA